MTMSRIIVHLLVLVSFLQCASCKIHFKKFNRFWSEFHPMSRPPVYFVSGVKGGTGASLLNCAIQCMMLPSCFMFCYKTDICALGHYGIPENNIDGHVALDETLLYECYFKNEFFNLTAEEMAYINNYTSVALNKETRMSSYIFGDSQFGGDRAVDGNRHGIFWDDPRTCCHSQDDNPDPTPYLLIKLDSTYLILAVNITNRGDGFQSRLHDVEVRAGFHDWDKDTNALFQLNSLCYEIDVTTELYIFRTCEHPPVIGRYVSLQIVRYCGSKPNCIEEESTNKNALSVCEVDVYAFLIGE